MHGPPPARAALLAGSVRDEPLHPRTRDAPARDVFHTPAALCRTTANRLLAPRLAAGFAEHPTTMDACHRMTRTVHSHSATIAAVTVSLAVLLLPGCASTPAPAPAAVAVPPPPATDFVIVASLLDTWNAIGQILTHADGVTYRARAQMMGLYDVEFRGERLLLIARAFVLDGTNTVPTTQVRIAAGDGKPDASAAAIELLHVVQVRLPEQLHRLATAPTPPPKPRRKARGKQR